MNIQNMDKKLMCRSCTGVADPGIYLLDPNHHQIYKWLQDILNLNINEHDENFTRLCLPCHAEIKKLAIFRERCEKSHTSFVNSQNKSTSTAEEFEELENRNDIGEQIPKSTINIKSSKSKTLLDKWLVKSNSSQNNDNTKHKKSSQDKDTNQSYAKIYNLKKLTVNIQQIELNEDLIQQIKLIGKEKENVGKKHNYKQTRKSRQQNTDVSAKSSSSYDSVAAENSISDDDIGDNKKSGSSSTNDKTPEIESKNSNKKRNVTVYSKKGKKSMIWNMCEIFHTVIIDPVTQKRSYKCCSKIFETSSKLNAHRTRVHRKSIFQCNLCDRKFKHQSALTDHLQRHGSERNFKCPKCPAAFKTYCDLSGHIKQVTHDDNLSFFCKFCSLSFASEKYCKTHERRKHSKIDLNIIPCTFCDRLFKTNYELKYHILRFHNDGLRPFKCSICLKFYKLKTDLNIHTFKMHNKNAKKYPCNYCETKFKSKYDLKIHFERHHNNYERKYKCADCFFDTKTKNDVRFHIQRYHIVNRKIFNCKSCDKKYISLSGLYEHKQKFHGDGKFRYYCDLCSSAYLTAGCLRRHKISKHNK